MITNLSGRRWLLHIIKRKGYIIADVARTCGVKPEYVHDMLRNGAKHDIPLDIFRQLASAIGYTVVLVPKDMSSDKGVYVMP